VLSPSPSRPPDADLALRLALGLVAVVSRPLPDADRRAWRAEWNAELVSRHSAVSARGRPGPVERLRLIAQAAGSLRDAWYLTAHGFGPANLAQDLGHAARALAKRPAFTLTAVVTLMLGIGANTALFSVVRGVLLRPFPYERPDRLVQILGQRAGADPESGNVSYPNLADVEAEVGGLASVAGMSAWRPALTGSAPEVLPGATVSWDYFQVLGVTPAAGRFFVPEEEGEGRDPVVVISHALWTRRFGTDPAIVGRTVEVNNVAHTVVGVAPAGFEGPHLVTFDGEQPEIWRTPWFEAAGWFRSGRSWKGVARLAEGADLAGVQGELDVAMTRLAEQYPEENADRRMTLRPLRDSIVGDARAALYVLLGAVSLVLLVACVNVATLFTGRMLERRGELLVRSALGASHGRLLTNLFAESFALAAVGGGLGVLVAYGGVRAIVGLAGSWLPRPEAISVDAGVLAFSAALAAATALLFGLVPAIRLLRRSRLSTLSGMRGAGGQGRRAGTLRRALVLGQIATTVVLVIGAGLLLQTFRNLQGVELGVARRGVITLDLHGAAWQDLEPAAAADRYRDILSRTVALPGVDVAGAIDVVPLSDNHSCDGVTPLDRPPPAPGEGRCAEVRSTTPGALEALGATLLSGRGLEWRDDPSAPGAMVITAQTAETFWPGQPVLGKRAVIHSDTFAVVGVVSDIRHFGPLSEVGPMVFLPSAQEPWNGIARGLSIVARGDRAVESLGPAIRDAVHAVDARIAVQQIRPMDALLAGTVGGPRLRAALLIVFAGLALALALVGISGVIAQAVARRRRELGIRIALGATPRGATGAVLGEGARITVLGLVVGLVAALGLTRLLRAFVFGVDPLDPRILAAGAGLVCALALLASWLPARRAARIDPVEALRAD